MKLKQINNEEIEISESGIPAIILGVAFAIVGLGAGLYPLVIADSAPWWVSLIGVGVIALGALVVFTATSRRTTLRRTGQSEVTTKKVVTGKTKSQVFNSDQIVQIGIETRTSYENSTHNVSDSRNSSPDRTRSSILYALLNDNTQIPLMTKQSNSSTSVGGVNVSGFGKAPLSDEAATVAQFFGVPLNSQSVNEVVPGLMQQGATLGQVIAQPAVVQPVVQSVEVAQPVVAQSGPVAPVIEQQPSPVDTAPRQQ